MTAVLLHPLLLAEPAADESAHVVQKLAAQLGEAKRLMEADPEGAVRLLNALLDDPKAREPAVAVLRPSTPTASRLYTWAAGSNCARGRPRPSPTT